MVIKRVSIFKRLAPSWDRHSKTDKHTEKVVRESWWLFGFIPLYIRDNVRTDNL